MDAAFRSRLSKVRTRTPLALVATTVALAAPMVLAPGASGAFSAPTNYSAGSGPVAVAVGSFNGDVDSYLDLAVANSSDNTVSILLGSPSGTFGAPTSFIVGPRPVSIAAGSFNGDFDSDPDLAVAYAGVGANPGGVSVLLGGPNGSFAGANFSAGFTPVSVAVGNFNGDFDSDPDLALVNLDSDNVSVLLGGPGGNFGAPTNFPVGDSPRDVATGDFNGDPDPDLVVVNHHAETVSVLVGGAGGAFSAPANFDLHAGNREPVGPDEVAVGDFNGDSDLDLAVTAGDWGDPLTEDVAVLLGQPGLAFGAPTFFSLGGNGARDVATGDFNGDSDLDLAVALNSNDRVNVLQGGGDGTFGGTLWAADDGPEGVAVADLVGDSRPDLVVANFSGLVSVLRNKIGAPQITATSPIPPSNNNNPAVKGTGAEAGSTVKLYATAACSGAPLGTGPAANFNGSVGITAANVPSNQTTNLRATATDATGDTSACSGPFSYLEDSTNFSERVPISGTEPPSPANDNNPEVIGVAEPWYFEPNSTVKIYGDSACAGPVLGTGPAAAIYEYGPGITVTVPDNQTTDLTAASFDQAGNAGPCSFGAIPYTEDSTAPAPPSIADIDPDSPANNNNPKVKGFGAEFGSTVKIYNNANRSCTNLVGTGTAVEFNSTTGITVTLPDNQTANLRATATNAVGNPSACSGPNPFPYTEDSSAPTAPAIAATSPASPANDNNPEVTGSGAETGSTVRLYNDPTCEGGSLVGTGTAAAFNGATGITATVPDNQTTHLYAAATDQVGNVSACSQPGFGYTENSTIPTTPDITGTDPDSPSPDPRPDIKGRAPAGSTVTIFASDRCSTAFEVVSGPASEFDDPGLPLRVESNTSTDFTATATIGANTSACSKGFTYVEDEDPPDTQIVTSPPNQSSASVGEFTFASPGGGTSFECRLDDAPFGPFSLCGAPHVTPFLDDGSHTLEVRALDAAGNVDPSPASYIWMVDTFSPATPAITVTSPTSPANDNNPEVTGTLGAGEPTHVKLYTDDSTCADPAGATGTVAAFTGAGITVAVAGDHTTELRARVVDLAGNLSSCSAAFAYTEDSTPPAVPSITATSPSSPADDNSPEVIGTVGSGTLHVKLYSDDSTCADPAGATGTVAAFTGAGITLAVAGDHTTDVRARAVDQAGNASACSGAFAYTEASSTPDPTTPDPTNPDPTLPGPTNPGPTTPDPTNPATTIPETTISKKPASKTPSRKAKFEFTSSEPGSSFACKLDSQPFERCSSPTTYKRLSPGKHTFKVQATNLAGKTDATPAAYTWKVKPK